MINEEWEGGERRGESKLGEVVMEVVAEDQTMSDCRSRFDRARTFNTCCNSLTISHSSTDNSRFLTSLSRSLVNLSIASRYMDANSSKMYVEFQRVATSRGMTLMASFKSFNNCFHASKSFVEE